MHDPLAKIRTAFIFTHQIQYFTNVLDELYRRGKIEVLGIYGQVTATMMDKGFARTISWDNRPNTVFPSTVVSQSKSKSIYRILRDFKPDVVHLNGYSDLIQWKAWFWAILNRKPIILRGDGDTLSDTIGRERRLNLILSRLFTRRAKCVFVQGEENRKFWHNRGASFDSQVWIPCVPDNNVYRKTAFANTEERDAFRTAAGADSRDTVFVISGKLDGRKRPKDGIDVLRFLQGVNCRIWFLGSGPLEHSLRTYAEAQGLSDRIFWFGFRNQSELPKVLQAADALLHTSEKDPWPYSVLEGAISGLPLVLSDKTGSYPDLISKSQAGLVFECGNLPDMARAIKLLVDNPNQRKEFGTAALSASLSHTEENFCKITEAVLQRFHNRS